MIEQDKFIYSSLGKAFQKQTKTIKDQGEKQIKAIPDNKKQELSIKNIIPETMLSDKAKKEMDKIMEIEKTVDKEYLIYRASEYTYSFKNFQTIKTFGRDIYNGKITLKEADNNQANLLVEIMDFKNNTSPKDSEKQKKKSRCS